MKSIISDPLWKEMRRAVSASFNVLLPQEFRLPSREVQYVICEGNFREYPKMWIYWSADIVNDKQELQSATGWWLDMLQKELGLVDWLQENYPDNCIIGDPYKEGERFYFIVSEVDLSSNSMGRDFSRMVESYKKRPQRLTEEQQQELDAPFEPEFAWQNLPGGQV